jgi:hypothetical protein
MPFLILFLCVNDNFIRLIFDISFLKLGWTTGLCILVTRLWWHSLNVKVCDLYNKCSNAFAHHVMENIFFRTKSRLAVNCLVLHSTSKSKGALEGMGNCTRCMHVSCGLGKPEGDYFQIVCFWWAGARFFLFTHSSHLKTITLTWIHYMYLHAP